MRIVTLCAVAAFMAAPGVRAQQPVHVPMGPTSNPTKAANRPQGVNAPVPPLLTAGRKVFLSNGGADAGLFPHPFTGTQDRAYAYFYKALAGSKRFEMVQSPAEADLVLEIQLTPPNGPLGDNKVKGTSDPLPTFKLTVYDRPTHYVLWTVTQTVDQAERQGTHDKNFDAALDSLLNELAAAAGTA